MITIFLLVALLYKLIKSTITITKHFIKFMNLGTIGIARYLLYLHTHTNDLDYDQFLEGFASDYSRHLVT